jgi:2,4'-dihydroxyacetophenone dioxygenase
MPQPMPILPPPAFCLEPARLSRSTALPWIPVSQGREWKPLRFLSDGRGFVELLRMAPGTAMPPHRHTGEVHVLHLAGQRRLCTGEIVSTGDYVHEPAGSTDAWDVVGEESLLAMVVVMGDVEFLAPDGSVQRRASARSQLQAYHAHCREHGLEIVALAD